MANENEWRILGPLIAAMVGLYGLFIKHVIGHLGQEPILDNKKEIQRLKEVVQYKDNCEQIVKRMDENHSETCRKLDRIWDKISNG